MTFSVIKLRPKFPRSSRSVVVMLVMTMYLLAGVLHGICDLDVTNMSGGTTIASVSKDTGQSEKGVPAEHHCHGCFSVSVPAPVTVGLEVKHAQKVVPLRQIERRGLPPGLDPPPPKSLT